MRLGADEHLVFQTAHLSDAASLVAAVCGAAQRIDTAAGQERAPNWPAPWMPPLPAMVTRDELPDDALGWCDEPDRQRRVPLRWSSADGSIIAAGTTGSGVTSTLRTLAERALRDPSTHVYVLTAATTTAEFLEHHRMVVVALHETERVHRLLHRLRMPDLDGASRVVLIDGLETVRRALDSPDSIDAFDALDEVLASVHDTLVVGTAQPSALPVALLARCAHRWVLHLHDAHDALTLGVSPRQVPPPIPGRIHVAATGLAAQLVNPTEVSHTPRDTSVGAAGLPIDPVEVVPAMVGAGQLPPGARGSGDLVLPLGVDFGTGRTHALVVPEGDHVLVLGGSRSGRSSTLTRLATAWREARPNGLVVAIVPRRSSFDVSNADHVVATSNAAAAHLLTDGSGTGHPLLVVCDDAELIDDVDGVLATFAANHRDDTTLIASARPDALRQRYGHWTTHVRHSRLGVVAAGGGDGDADLLGTVLPRRLPVRPRAGLMWTIDEQGHRLVQVSLDVLEAPASRRVSK
jgi:S-DNA-T family DNA segregation ATPase FtsK/SpoIIIE